jgi:TPR repeat protein
MGKFRCIFGQVLAMAVIAGTCASGAYAQAASSQNSKLALLIQNANFGDAKAQIELGNDYHLGHLVIKNAAQAAFWYHKAAEQGNVEGQIRLAVLYDYGEQGVPQDHAQAAIWYRRAAEQGESLAQTQMGVIYHEGSGVPQDDTQSAIWYRKAAEQGVSIAQSELGSLYMSGSGVPQDYTQAAYWYRKAAEQGDPFAQMKLGALHAWGSGVPQDYTQAVYWLRKAAEQGESNAQNLLGMLYASGSGVPQDYAEAYFWYDVALAGSIDKSMRERAVKARDSLASHLTPSTLQEVQSRATKWFAAHTPSNAQ